MSQNYKIINPVTTRDRPFWSVVIPTHNCAHFLKDTLYSVLEQDQGEHAMEIIVVDDCSTKDNPEEVVNEFGKGRVRFISQSKNVGKVKNYETGLEVTTGKVIHVLHGDDRVRPGFYRTMQSVLIDNPTAKAAFCRSLYIDEKNRWTGLTGIISDQEGVVENMLEQLYVKQQIQTPSMVVRREVYEQIGAFDRRLNAMEDWEMWIRIANNYPIAASNRVLAEYRSHHNNATAQTFNDGSALGIHEKVYEIVDSYVKETVKSKFKRQRNKSQADFLFNSLLQNSNHLSMTIKTRIKKRIVKLDPSLRVLIRTLLTS